MKKFKDHVIKMLMVFSAFGILAGGIYLQRRYIKQRAEEQRQARQEENISDFSKTASIVP